jgi:hypothetical protein
VLDISLFPTDDDATMQTNKQASKQTSKESEQNEQSKQIN